MDIGIFDNYEDDGQLTLFGLEDGYEELLVEPGHREQASQEQPSMEQSSGQAGADIRIRCCGSCGKLLFVKEEAGGYVSACNACGIQYRQRIQ